MAKDHGPSVKDDRQYEALRRQGESKEKAARIANAGKPQPDRAQGRQGRELRGPLEGGPAEEGAPGRDRGALEDEQARADQRPPEPLTDRRAASLGRLESHGSLGVKSAGMTPATNGIATNGDPR